MKNKFYCQNCDYFFEEEGEKIEYQDKIYGHCWKRIAYCPKCKTQCDQYQPKTSPKKTKSPEFGSDGGCGCGFGGGCCG